MITKIGEKDAFGYDDQGRPVAAKIGPNAIVFGYPFCWRLHEAIAVGFKIIHSLYADGGALLAIYSPQAKTAEIWFGKWTEDKPGEYHIVEPGYQGITDAKLDDFASAKNYVTSSDPKPLRPGYLQTSGDHSEIVRPDFTADSWLNWRLRQKPPTRYPNIHVVATRLDVSERPHAGDIEYVIKNLFEYPYRIRTAIELNKYAELMHFSTPATIPPSIEKFALLMEWKHIAARDTAFSIFHFQKSFETLRESILRKCPMLRNRVDTKKLRLSWKLYRSWFADAVHTRHAVGHSAEFYATAEDRTRHMAHEGIFVESFMLNDVLSLSSFGKFVSVEVSDKTVEKLERIRSLILESLSEILEPR